MRDFWYQTPLAKDTFNSLRVTRWLHTNSEVVRKVFVLVVVVQTEERDRRSGELNVVCGRHRAQLVSSMYR